MTGRELHVQLHLSDLSVFRRKPKATGHLDRLSSAGAGDECLLLGIVMEGIESGPRSGHGDIVVRVRFFWGAQLPTPEVRRNHDAFCETDDLGT